MSRRKINDLSKRLKEVYEILSYLPEKDLKKIPKEVLTNIKDNMDKKYNFELDKTKKIYEQPLNKDTMKIICYLNYKYIVNQEQREYLEKIYKINSSIN